MTMDTPTTQTFNQTVPPTVTAWNDALEAAAIICERVNNYDNPMTASDCADAIRALKAGSSLPSLVKPQRPSERPNLNDWFCSLPEPQRAMLREDKWALAYASFDAGVLAGSLA